MVNPFLIIAGTYLLGEAYKKYVPREQKRKLESSVGIHHGEAGVFFTVAGILSRSLGLTASGIGLMLHDSKDSKKWFSGDKNKVRY